MFFYISVPRSSRRWRPANLKPVQRPVVRPTARPSGHGLPRTDRSIAEHQRRSTGIDGARETHAFLGKVIGDFVLGLLKLFSSRFHFRSDIYMFVMLRICYMLASLRTVAIVLIVG